MLACCAYAYWNAIKIANILKKMLRKTCVINCNHGFSYKVSGSHGWIPSMFNVLSKNQILYFVSSYTRGIGIRVLVRHLN